MQRHTNRLKPASPWSDGHSALVVGGRAGWLTYQQYFLLMPNEM